MSESLFTEYFDYSYKINSRKMKKNVDLFYIFRVTLKYIQMLWLSSGVWHSVIW
jgi:hypothetical protein